MDDCAGDIAALVRRASAGDRAAFADLIRFHERTALSVAYATVGCAATAADVVQEAFLRAWQRLDRLDEPARFASWLCRIVKNLGVDAIRRRPKNEVAMQRVTPADDAPPPPQALGVATAPASDERLQLDETRQRVNAALAELDELSRLTVTLRYYQNLSSKQIGELVGLSPAAVDMRLSRARQQLRDRLDQSGRSERREDSNPPALRWDNGSKDNRPMMPDFLACADGGLAS